MQKFNCKTCGAELYWDADAGALKCEYCESVFHPSDFEDETLTETPVEKLKDDTLNPEYTNSSDILTEDMVVYECSHCGAEVITSKTTMATTCAYCGRAISLTNKSVGEFRPDKVLAFKVNRDKAIEIYNKYIKSSFLIPKLFKEEQTIKKMQGLYVPFFLHSANLNAKGVVNAENVMNSRRGDDKIEHHSLYKIDLDIDGMFDKIPTDASKKIDNKLMDSLEPFDLESLNSFNPAYMAGYFAEQPDEKVEDTTSRATERMELAMKQKMDETAGNYSIKTVSSFEKYFVGQKSEYAMLPVWLLNVEYNNKMYTFAINGDTGKAVGKLPISKGKLLGLALGSFFGTQAIFILINALTML